MRLWHKNLIRFLPDMQLKGQWRECALIARQIKENGTPNHLLVNRIMEYSMDEFTTYCFLVYFEITNRGFKATNESVKKIEELKGKILSGVSIFDGWHNKEYLRVCMANLYEKHFFGIGKSRITDDEWARLCEGYEKITGEKYVI